MTEIGEAGVELTALGRLAHECWIAIPQHFPQTALHEFVIMPNHLHGILAITSSAFVGAQHRCALRSNGATPRNVTPRSLGAIVRSFEAIVTRRAHRELRWHGPPWQRNYFERVLRDGNEFADASRYIAEIPIKWSSDRENPQFRSR